MTVAGVILAGGPGTRFAGDRPKLLALLRGKPLVVWAVEPALEAGLDEVVVVTGAADLRDVVPDEVTLLQNEIWDQGQATTLRVGLDWCARRGHDAAVIALGDQPYLLASAWKAVAAAEGTPIAVATYAGRRGHPVRLAADVWPIMPVNGDAGARAVISQRPELVSEVPCDGNPRDIDTLEDLRRWS